LTSRTRFGNKMKMKACFVFFRNFFLPALLCALLLVPACDPGEPARKVDLSKRKQIQTQRVFDSLTYACLPQYSHRVSYARHHRLVAYLSEKTELPIYQIFAVYLGEVDIGSIREGTLELVKDRVDLDAIRVLDNTQRFPSWVYAAAKGLDPDAAEKIKQALLALDAENPEHREILELAHFRGIIPASDPDFDPIRELIRKVEVMPRD